ncbi:hypothetical protein BU15DRAFT_78666 [Melanogaster broomeanus]|nr:hypothetical protein BU15DRAFT_78666 [Melanogaster broomeanus]
MFQPPSVIDVDSFQETLRKAQKERDHYRSETARLRTENATLLNELDVLKAQLSDIDGERVIQDAVEAQRKACVNSIQTRTSERQVGVTDPTSPSSWEGSLPTDARAHNIFDELSEATVNLDEAVRKISIRWDDDSEDLESVPRDDVVSIFDPAVPPSEGFQEPIIRPDILSRYTKTSPLQFYRGNGGKALLTLSAERIARCLENVSHISCVSPRSSVEVSATFSLGRLLLKSHGASTKLQVPVSHNRTTMRHLLLGSQYLYFPIELGSPGLLLSCRKELMKGNRNWSCFAPTPNVNSSQMVYMGDYQLSYIGDLSPEEYNLQTTKVCQESSAHQKFDPPKKQKGVKREKGDFKVEEEALQNMMDAFATGREKIHIIGMTFEGYDLDFAEYVQAKYLAG